MVETRRDVDDTYDDGEPRLLVLLVEHLRADVDTGEPAAVAGVAVVPADGVLQTTSLADELEVADHVLIGLHLRVDSRLGTLDGQGERIHNDHGIAVDLALHQAHHFELAARPSVHHLHRSKQNVGARGRQVHLLRDCVRTILSNATAEILTFLK